MGGGEYIGWDYCGDKYVGKGFLNVEKGRKGFL